MTWPRSISRMLDYLTGPRYKDAGLLSGEDCRALMNAEERAINVDTILDLMLAEQLLLLRQEPS